MASTTESPTYGSIPSKTLTVFEAIVKSLKKAGTYNRNDQSKPAAVLWTDKDQQWEELIPALRKELPQLLTFGTYDANEKAGPAIWLRCMVARSLPEADWSQKVVPIIYLGGVSRQELRAVEECPKELQPLAELQYRGVFWTQLNAKDWTVAAFLQSKDGGLGLDVARDQGTRNALKRAVKKVAESPTEYWSGKHLVAHDFDALLSPDPDKRVLAWMNNPDAFRKQCTANEWEAFVNTCRDTYGLHPELDGVHLAAERLGLREGSWDNVWQRFEESPRLFPNLPELLRSAKPAGQQILFTKESWPQDNEQQEDELRGKLAGMKELTTAEANALIAQLDQAHSRRRKSVWAGLGHAPLALALKHLKDLVEATGLPAGGTSPDKIADTYALSGWRADAAVLDALACVRTQRDAKAVEAALHTLYKPWLDDLALLFQNAINEAPLPGIDELEVAEVDEGVCVLFADGLRFDVGQKLNELMNQQGWEMSCTWGWAAMPSVTPAAKPAVSPIAKLLSGEQSSEEFFPQIRADGRALNIERFRKLLEQEGFQVLGSNDTGDSAKRAWAECGAIDSNGHKQGWKLAWRIAEELQTLMHRIEGLFDAGWKEIQIVTDHGWLLLPGGLPKAEMPHYLTSTKWGRCAIIKKNAQTDLPMVPWFWNKENWMVVPPGACCFRAGIDYVHGGLSLQECVIPRITVRPGSAGRPQAGIQSVKWVGLRCRVTLEGDLAGLKVDLRTNISKKESSLSIEKKPVDVSAAGKAAILVEKDEREGDAVTVVLLSADNRVIDKKTTTVGEN